MEPVPRILLVGEVAQMLRVAPVSIYRWVALRRRQVGTFPLPISARGGKLRFNAEDIEAYLQSQSENTLPNSIAISRQMKTATKEQHRRQKTTETGLARHGLNRNSNKKETQS